MKVVICAIAKFEYDYIKEWVEYNLNLGFDKITIYDNNDLDGEKYDELLSEFIEKGQVELRDVRGKRAMQRVVYNEFYHNDDFDWVTFIDIDEFISPNRTKYKNIKEFIEKNSFADAIYLYWQTYGDAGKTYPTNINPRKNNTKISVLKQYNIPADKGCIIDDALKTQNSWGKSIIKKGLPIKYLHEHFVTDPNNLKYVDCFGKNVCPYLFSPDEKYVESTYKECYVKHLYTKSLYEYIEYKVRRPAANNMGEMHFPSKYFKVNEINEEKRKYLESIGYKMEFVFKPDIFLVIEVKNLEEYNLLKPYLMNLIKLCSCRLYLCVTEDQSAVEIIDKDIENYFNECAVYYYKKDNVLSEFCIVFREDIKSIINKTNCVVHLNIPYGVNANDYISEYIDPIFNLNNIKYNFLTLLNSNKGIYTTQVSIDRVNKNSDSFVRFSKEFSKIGIKADIDYATFNGNFIAKTKDILEWKNVYDKISVYINTYPEDILYFISSMFNTFLFQNK